MKQITPILVLLTIFFSGCGNSQALPTSIITPLSTNTPIFALSTPTSTLTPIESAESWNTLKPLLDNVSNGREISPNGQWIIYRFYINQKLNLNRAISINNQNLSLDIQYILPNPTPHWYDFYSWSPDSTGFIGIFFGETTSGSDYCCGQAIEISNFSNGTSQSYMYTWGWFEKPDIYWSWDSSKIGLAFRDNGLWIIDRQGNLIKKISLNDISSLIWSKNSIYATTYTPSDQNHHYKYNIYKVNLGNNSTEQIYTFDGYVDLIAYDENLNQLLIAASYPPIKFLLFDLTKRKMVKEVSLPSGIYDLETSPSLQYTAMSTDDNSLWIFDLNNQSLEYYGKLASTGYGNGNPLLGWFSNINGFLAKTENGDLKVIKP